MRFGALSLLSLMVACLMPGVIFGQSVSRTVTAGGTANIDLILSAGFESSITLTLTGNTVAPATALSNIVAGDSAYVDFGTVATSCSIWPVTGACFRLTDESGARLVATIDAKVTATGDATPLFDLGIEAAAVIFVNNKLFRVCGGDGSCPAEMNDTYWEDPINGNVIPDVGSSFGTELASDAVSGSVIEHQLAMEVLDSATPAGDLNLRVTYIAGPD